MNAAITLWEVFVATGGFTVETEAARSSEVEILFLFAMGI